MLRFIVIGLKRILQGVILTIALIAGYVIIGSLCLRFVGYFPNGIDWNVAPIIVARDGKAEDCMKIIHLLPHLFSPSEDEQRAGCIHEYAKLTEDPSACELLMPSSYGWDCLGAAMDFRLCILGEGPTKVVRGQGKITNYDQCLSGPDSIKNYSCCQMARMMFQSENKEICETLSSDPLRDECHYDQAIRKKDIESCSLIDNERNRTGCQVGVRALLMSK